MNSLFFNSDHNTFIDILISVLCYLWVDCKIANQLDSQVIRKKGYEHMDLHKCVDVNLRAWFYINSCVHK